MSAKYAYQRVISTASQQGSLPASIERFVLKYGAVIVIESTYKTVIDLVREIWVDPFEIVEERQQFIPVFFGFILDVVD